MSVKRTFLGYKAVCDATYCFEEKRGPGTKIEFIRSIESDGWWCEKRVLKTVCLCPHCKEALSGLGGRLSELRDELIHRNSDIDE